MPPFRYLGNILRLRGHAFFAWAWGVFRLGRGRGKAGLVPKMEDARFGSRSFSRFDIDRFVPLCPRCGSLRVY